MELQDILLAEDEPLIRMLVEEALIEAGYSVSAATTGEDGLALLNQSDQAFVGLVTDIRMPGPATGWDLAHRARELNQDISIVYISADSADDWPVHGVPGSVFVQKPFAAAQIISALSTLLNKAG